MALTIGALVLLGNAIRDALEDGEKIKHRKKPRRSGVRNARRRRPPPRAQSRKSVAAVDAGTEHHLVKVTNLGVGYPQADGSIKKVVDDVSFHVDRGEILGIVGESGSGKSQTAFSILGLLPDNARIVAGAIQFDGNYTVAPGEDTRQPGAPVQTARQADFLHPAGAHEQPGPGLHHRLPAGHAHGAGPRHLQGRGHASGR